MNEESQESQEIQESQDNILELWISEQFSTINDSLTLFKMEITNIQKVVYR